MLLQNPLVWNSFLNQKRPTENCPLMPPPPSGPFQGVTLHVLEIKKIYQLIINNVNLSVLKLEKRYLHQNVVEFKQKLIGNIVNRLCRRK